MDMRSPSKILYRKMFLQKGALSTISNPKVAIFYFAYLFQCILSSYS
jgi:threonine/homoserine/homoserine lactone efflux protein